MDEEDIACVGYKSHLDDKIYRLWTHPIQLVYPLKNQKRKILKQSEKYQNKVGGIKIMTICDKMVDYNIQELLEVNAILWTSRHIRYHTNDLNEIYAGGGANN